MLRVYGGHWRAIPLSSEGSFPSPRKNCCGGPFLSICARFVSGYPSLTVQVSGRMAGLGAIICMWPRTNEREMALYGTGYFKGNQGRRRLSARGSFSGLFRSISLIVGLGNAIWKGATVRVIASQEMSCWGPRNSQSGLRRRMYIHACQPYIVTGTTLTSQEFRPFGRLRVA